MQPIATDICGIVPVSVCLFETTMYSAKMAEPIEMPFGVETRVGPSNHVLDGGMDPSRRRDSFGGWHARNQYIQQDNAAF